MYQDKTLKCKECGEDFVFTAGEQEFYAEKGFQNEPQRCKTCRDARKNNGRGQRELFTTVCAKCGKEAKVPFQPSNDRPVYCSECYAAMKAEEEEVILILCLIRTTLWSSFFVLFCSIYYIKYYIFLLKTLFYVCTNIFSCDIIIYV